MKNVTTFSGTAKLWTDRWTSFVIRIIIDNTENNANNNPENAYKLTGVFKESEISNMKIKPWSTNSYVVSSGLLFKILFYVSLYVLIYLSSCIVKSSVYSGVSALLFLDYAYLLVTFNHFSGQSHHLYNPISLKLLLYTTPLIVLPIAVFWILLVSNVLTDTDLLLVCNNTFKSSFNVTAYLVALTLLVLIVVIVIVYRSYRSRLRLMDHTDNITVEQQKKPFLPSEAVLVHANDKEPTSTHTSSEPDDSD